MRERARSIGVLAGIVGLVWLLFLMFAAWMGDQTLSGFAPRWMAEFSTVGWLATGAVLVGSIVGRTGSFWGPLVAGAGFLAVFAWAAVSIPSGDSDRDSFVFPFLVFGFVEAAAAAVLFRTRHSQANQTAASESPTDTDGQS